MRGSLTVFGDTQFDREIRLIGRRATEARPAYDAIGWFLSRVVAEQFATSGARSGRPWQPLADSTIKRKGSATILVDSGALRDSFIYGDDQNIWDVSDDYLHWGSANEYGAYHQGGRGVPERKVFDLNDADRNAITKSLQRWVMEGSALNLEVGIL